MPRSVDDLELHAAKFWPTVLARQEQSSSIIPKLLESQERFIGILYVADASPTAWKDVLQATDRMPANLFLKHVMVLSDVSGEKVQRYHKDIDTFFPTGAMTFRWKDTEYNYRFKTTGSRRRWNNVVLQVDGKGLARDAALSDAVEDTAMLLIHGGASVDPGIPDDVLEKCVIGSLIGRKRELDTFVRQRYIQVSRITGGATANAMGQLCQAYVRKRLQDALPTWDLSRHTIPGISQNAGRTDMSFRHCRTLAGWARLRHRNQLSGDYQ